MASALLSESPSAMETSPLFLGGILVVCVCFVFVLSSLVRVLENVKWVSECRQCY